jgi:hypothetical protein
VCVLVSVGVSQLMVNMCGLQFQRKRNSGVFLRGQSMRNVISGLHAIYSSTPIDIRSDIISRFTVQHMRTSFYHTYEHSYFKRILCIL